MLVGVPIIDLKTRQEGFVIRVISESLFEVEFSTGEVRHYKMDDTAVSWDYA